MPPRWAAIGIVLFWLGCTTWLIQRDMWPTWFPPPDNPPPVDIDMIDELGTTASWHVYVDGEDAGMGSSEVKIVPEDGSLVFRTTLRFQKKPLLEHCASIETVNHITNQGQLLDFSMEAKLKIDPKSEQLFVLDLKAKVDKGFLKAKASIFGLSKELDPVAVPENGIVFNPAALGTRVRRIYKGQTWRVPSLDVAAFLPADAKAFIKEAVLGGELWAKVDEEVIKWGDEDVLCYRIDLRKLGKEVEASSWVRKRDGQVLKQKQVLKPMGMSPLELLLVRVHHPNN